MTELRARRLAQRVLVDGRLIQPAPNLEHGRHTTYSNWGCRCHPCTDAWRDYGVERRAKQFAARVVDTSGTLVAPPGVRHGLAATYRNWGCRCTACAAASAGHRRGWRQKRAVSS